jgi:hypothetical protein
MAMNLAMVVTRLPEFADNFQRELVTANKTALGSSEAILFPAVEAATAEAEAEADAADEDEYEDVA